MTFRKRMSGVTFVLTCAAHVLLRSLPRGFPGISP